MPTFWWLAIDICGTFGLRELLFLLVIGNVISANAESVSPWVIDDPTDVSTESRVRLSTTAFAASDFAPAIRFAGEAQNAQNPPKPGLNRALGIGQAGAYSEYSGFQIGAFRRIDAFGTADSDVLTAIQALHSKTSLEAGRTYSGSYSYRVTDMAGIRIGKAVELPLPDKSGWSTTLGVSISPLHGVSIRQDSVSASLYDSASNNYILDGQRSQANSTVLATSYNAYLPNGNPSANGYTSDLGLSIQNAGGVRLYLISDLASRLNWHAVPARTYSVQGFTGMRGTQLPSGFATTAPFSSELTGKTTIGMNCALQSFVIEGAVTRVDGLNDPTLAVTHELGGGWSAQLSAHPYWRALGLGLSHRKFGRLRIVSDNANINQARALGLQFDTGFVF